MDTFDAILTSLDILKYVCVYIDVGLALATEFFEAIY